MIIACAGKQFIATDNFCFVCAEFLYGLVWIKFLLQEKTRGPIFVDLTYRAKLTWVDLKKYIKAHLNKQMQMFNSTS